MGGLGTGNGARSEKRSAEGTMMDAHEEKANGLVAVGEIRGGTRGGRAGRKMKRPH